VRSAEGVFLADGPVLLSEALEAGAAVRTVYVERDPVPDAVRRAVDAAAEAGVRVREVMPGVLAKVLDLATPQGVVALVERTDAALADLVSGATRTGRPLLVLESVADPGNVGTLVRTAEASGCAGVVLVGACADRFNPKTVRSTAGAIFRVPVAEVDDIDELAVHAAAAGITLVGAAGGAGEPPERCELRHSVAILVGSEAHGLSAAALQRCDRTVAIPMEGRVESLNAAVAGSVLAFEAARQRRAGDAAAPPPDRSGGTTTAVGHNDRPVATGSLRPERPAPEHGSPPR
jgi:TrmH family RNA methyltransferase